MKKLASISILFCISGGLGTMGIKLAKALGNDVMAISSSAHKEALAKEKGATMFACSRVSKNVSSGQRNFIKTYLGTKEIHI